MFVRRDRIRVFRARIKSPQQLPGVDIKPRITPDVSRVEKLSVTEPAITMVLSVIIGGEVGSYRPGLVSGILLCRLSTPLLAKVSHSLPFSALIAISRPSLTGRMIRRGQSAHHFRRSSFCFGFMIRDATAGYVLEGLVGFQLRIVMPFLFTAGGIQRKQTLMRGTQVKGVAHFNWRHFIGDFTWIVRLLHIASTEHPASFSLWTLSAFNLFQG